MAPPPASSCRLHCALCGTRCGQFHPPAPWPQHHPVEPGAGPGAGAGRPPGPDRLAAADHRGRRRRAGHAPRRPADLAGAGAGAGAGRGLLPAWPAAGPPAGRRVPAQRPAHAFCMVVAGGGGHLPHQRGLPICAAGGGAAAPGPLVDRPAALLGGRRGRHLDHDAADVVAHQPAGPRPVAPHRGAARKPGLPAAGQRHPVGRLRARRPQRLQALLPALPARGVGGGAPGHGRGHRVCGLRAGRHHRGDAPAALQRGVGGRAADSGDGDRDGGFLRGGGGG